MRNQFPIALLLGSLIGLLCPGCEQPAAEQEEVIRPIKVHTIGSLQPAAIREFPGTIRAFQTAQMGFEVAGRIEKFLVREGDQVQQGDLLAELDPTDYEASLKVAEANLKKAQTDLDRSNNIRAQDPGAISMAQIESDTRALEVTQAQLEIAKKAVRDTKLVAPFAGVMARKLVEDYANVQAKEPVLILQDNSVLEIEVAVPERDFVRRKYQNETKEQTSERLQAKVLVSAVPDRDFPATIREYATVADPVTRTFAVKLNFENPQDVNILPGMTARVRIVIDPQSAWSVPVTAAQADENGQAYVWKVNPETMTVSKHPVELGPLSGDRVLLTDGVSEGEMVAISGVTALREGMQVRQYESQTEGSQAE